MAFRHIADEFKDKVIADYQGGMSLKEIKATHNVQPCSLAYWFKRKGITPRVPNFVKFRALDEGVFSGQRLSENGEYWIGFLMADGCVSRRSDRNISIILQIAERDRSHVEEFRSFLKSDAPIATIASDHPQARLAVTSRKLGEALISFGVVPKKSHTAKAKGLEHSRHFWRGVVDGDGSVSLGEYGPQLSLCGSKQLVTQFRDFCGFDATIEPNKMIWRVRFNGWNAIQVISRLYGACSTALDRKASTARECLAHWLTQKDKWGPAISNIAGTTPRAARDVG